MKVPQNQTRGTPAYFSPQRRRLLLGLCSVFVGDLSASACDSPCGLYGHQRHASVDTIDLYHLVDYDDVILRSHVVATSSHHAKQQISTLGSVHDYLHHSIHLYSEYGHRTYVGKAPSMPIQ